MYSAFMELCENKDFDTAIACGVLERMDPSKEFEYAPKWKGTIYSPMWFTPLSMAVFYNNLKMVQLLDQAIAYWLVLFGFGGVTKDDKLSVRMCDGLEPSMFKEFEKFTYKLIKTSCDFELRILNKETKKVVAIL